jgi:PST family polysaccharide transporter
MPQREGAFWVLVALAVPRALGAIFTVALRRYLGPGTAGIFDLAYAPYRFLDNFRNFGTGPALVYERTINRAAANTAWTVNMISAVLVTLAAQLLAGPIARYYGHPGIEGALRLLSIAYIFASISSVHWFLLLRDMNFRARSVAPIGQVAVAGCVAILFAVWGFGVGVLVARELTSVVVGVAVLWLIYPYRPRLQLVPHLAWQLLRYGAWVGAGVTLIFLSQNVDVFIGGRIIHRARDIGFYTTSWSLAFIGASVVATVAGSMVFPALSRLQDSPIVLAGKLLAAVRLLGMVMLPAAALLAVLAPVLIVPVLGTRFSPYRPSFPVLSLLSLYAGNRTMLWIFFEGYKSIGRPWLIPAYNGVKLVITVPALILGAEHGILGMAVAYLPIQAIEFPAGLLLAKSFLSVSPPAVWRALRTAVVTTFWMAGSVLASELALQRLLHLGDTPTLLICLPVAALAYTAAILTLDRGAIGEAHDFLLHGL